MQIYTISNSPHDYFEKFIGIVRIEFTLIQYKYCCQEGGNSPNIVRGFFTLNTKKTQLSFTIVNGSFFIVIPKYASIGKLFKRQIKY
ncbi:hypothetical protein FGO68_gene1422 [Halteria grandinella]|uniref:Uncharacterized protein n=1 Tax=Halteria grandinella TaxID=5974 RepID=A0A8J8SXV2_HALGN|nr:hypothetical protein FGO68_gene1422 [Halteria grandinella]